MPVRSGVGERFGAAELLPRANGDGDREAAPATNSVSGGASDVWRAHAVQHCMSGADARKHQRRKPSPQPLTEWKSDGDTFVGHGGSSPGYRSHLLLRPQDEIATAFMTDGQDVNARRFAQTAYDIVAPALRKAAGKTDGASAASEAAAAASSGRGETVARETLTRFTGTHQRPLGGEAAVLIREGDLQVLPLPPTIRWKH